MRRVERIVIDINVIDDFYKKDGCKENYITKTRIIRSESISLNNTETERVVKIQLRQSWKQREINNNSNCN